MFLKRFCTQLHNIKYSYLIQIICPQLYGFKYSYPIQIICTQLYCFKYSYQILITISSSSSSSCRATSTDIPDPLSPLFPIVHHLRQVFQLSSHSCCMYVLAGRPAFARPYVGVHWSTSLMSSFLLLQQCPACLMVSSNYSYLIIIICFHTFMWFQVFLSTTNNYMVSSNYFYLIIIICLHTVIWFQVTNNNLLWLERVKWNK